MCQGTVQRMLQIKTKKQKSRKILKNHSAYNLNSRKWSKCLNEKLKIALRRGFNMISKQTEIINKCRHKCYDSKY